MLAYPSIDPVAFHLGPLAIHWYGLMYLVAFASCWGVLALRVKTTPRGFTVDQLSDLLFYIAVGVVVGGRLGYMVFYNWNELLHAPWRTFMVWEGGMSFHGGLLGVTIALALFARHIQKPFGDVADLIAPAVPLGLAAGRIGNFINGELWGKITTVPWGMVFPAGGDVPRHPSQLYEFFLEGIVMFTILWIYSQKPRPRWAVSGLFLILYGIFRIFVEFYREPDIQIGYLAFSWLTEGQLLSIPMIIAGYLLMTWAYRKKLCSNI